MFVNVIKSYRDTVAICDSELLGKYFEEGKFQLDIKENFYKGEEKSAQEVIQIIQDMKKEDATFNIVGERSVDTAIKAGLVKEDSIGKSIGKIKNIPFILVLM